MENFLAPKGILKYTIEVGVKKAKHPIVNMLILGFLAGAFIAFAAQGSNMGAFNLWATPNSYGLGKALAGALFTTGLMLVIIAGAELFTGNNLMILAVLEKKISLNQMFRNWFFVYLGNFLGSIFIAFLIYHSGQLNASSNLLGAMTIKIAVYKVELTFTKALILGLFCNWLVCLAVWLAYAAKDITGKILAIFFPIWLFVTSGFEHSIANMYYVPAGIFAKNSDAYVLKAKSIGVSTESINNLNWNNFFYNNLFPVTLGNIIGGLFFVGVVYWMVYKEKSSHHKI